MSIGFEISTVPVDARHIAGLKILANAEVYFPSMTPPGPDLRQPVSSLVDNALRLRARRLAETLAVLAGADLVGLVFLSRRPGSGDVGELGYWIGRAHRSRGYATTAAGQAVAHGFVHMRLDAVVARCDATHRAPARVVERLGFRFVGLETAQGRPVLRRYELTRADYFLVAS